MTAGQVKDVQKCISGFRAEISKAVVGQDDVVDALVRALLANGHVIVEGMPGVAKTLLIRVMAAAIGGSFGRIQFTVDMLPSDITGVATYIKERGFMINKGPIFANFVIADEINRAPPKTQSALLEAMQERQVTIARETYKLPSPFFVMANNNPIESSGTYPLPEAQMDRFLFKVLMGYPTKQQEKLIMELNSSLHGFEEFNVKPALSPAHILKMQAMTKLVGHKERIKEYIAEIVDWTRYPGSHKYGLGRFVEYGASPRASINLFIAAKADALMSGERFITPENVKKVAHDVLRHRILLNYQGQAEGIKTDDIISEILAKVRIP